MELRIYRKKVVNIWARFFVRLPIGCLTAVFDRFGGRITRLNLFFQKDIWRRHPPEQRSHFVRLRMNFYHAVDGTTGVYLVCSHSELNDSQISPRPRAFSSDARVVNFFSVERSDRPVARWQRPPSTHLLRW